MLPPVALNSALRVATIAAIVALALAGSWNHGLWIYDEPREAELARALWRSGEWTYTVLNEQPFLEKPPLYSLSVAASFALVGHPSILAARVVSALWSLATLGVVAWFAAQVADRRTGVLAAAVLATTNRFETCQHAILLDNALVAFTTAALAFGYVAAIQRRRALAVLAGGALAGAFLVKGVVGVAIVVLVLATSVAWRRDREAARTLLHPLALAAAIVPPALYALLLARRGGDLCHELFWNNQVGRFVDGYATKGSPWHLYASTSWEMLAPWTPLAALAVLRPPSNKATRFLLVWALAPLVALSFSQARARNYAIPVTPAFALLVALSWHELTLPRWAREGLAWLWLAAAVAIAGITAALVRLGEADAVALVAAVVAAGSLAARRSSEKETLGLGLALLAISGWLLWACAFVAAQREPGLSFDELARQVHARAGSRRLVLFHNSDSYSGTFAFQADRSLLGFDVVNDPRGERLVASVTSNDVVLAPAGALMVLSEERRREFQEEWRHAWDARHEFVLYRRRTAP